MYTPKKYQNKDLHQIKAFIRSYGFGTLITYDGDKPIATHIPIELKEKEGKDYLIGHISKANPQWKTFESSKEVLAIFTAHHAYISSSWYSEETVSTWNYIAVHVYGKIKIVEEDALYQSLEALVDKYEQNSEQPTHIGISIALLTLLFLCRLGTLCRLGSRASLQGSQLRGVLQDG